MLFHISGNDGNRRSVPSSAMCLYDTYPLSWQDVQVVLCLFLLCNRQNFKLRHVTCLDSPNVNEPMADLSTLVEEWLANDKNPSTRDEISELWKGRKDSELEKRLRHRIEFGTAGKDLNPIE